MNYTGFNLKTKVDAGYATLNPITSVTQVLNLDAGKVFGPYIFTLELDNWVLNQQTFAAPELVSTDIPMVTKVLIGTVDQMKAQNTAFGLLDSDTGVESLDGEIIFTTTRTPDTTYQVQVWWTR